MAWTEFTRRLYERSKQGYSSDVSDDEWAIVVPLLPAANRLGRPREVDLRDVWNAIQYVAAAGCAWSLLPKDFPPVSTVRYYFYGWRDNGLLAEINRALVVLARRAEGRSNRPAAGVIDSQSVKTTENGGICGYDAGKRIKGRKRHIMTDTCGHLLAIRVHVASIQDRDGAPAVFALLKREAPKLRHVFAPFRRLLRKSLPGNGWWVCRTKIAWSAHRYWTLGYPDRETLRHSPELRSDPAKMGCGANLRVARTLPSTGQGLGENHRERRGMGPYRPYPAANEASRKTMKSYVPF